MRKWYHLIKKPESPVMTRQERLEERLQFEKDLQFAKLYWMFFLFMILFASVVSAFVGDDFNNPWTIHEQICQKVPNSPLCKDEKAFLTVHKMAKEKWVPTRLVIGIWFAESTIWTNFNKDVCYSYYNWAWLKWRKFDDGRVEMYADDRGKPDKNGCWLYKFESWEDWVNSFLNTIAIGYKWCNMKTECIAYDFVGKPDVAEKSWIANVEAFYSK